METLKNILIDSLNGFSLKMIPLFLFQILSAGLMAHVIQIIINKKLKDKIVNHAALMAVSITVIVSIVKYSLPFSVLAAAVILLLMGKRESSKIEILSIFLIGSIGVGCGVGSVIQTALGFTVIGLVILFTPLKNKNDIQE